MEKKIIGRDRLLEKEVYPRVKSNKGFVITGQRGIGKTEILKWAYEQYQGKKVYISCMGTYGDMIKEIARELEIIISKKKVSEIEEEIMKSEAVAIFLDDANQISKKRANFLISYDERASLYLAGIEPFKEDSKRILWGKKKIKLHAIEKTKRYELGRYIATKTGSTTPISIIANEGRGVPARSWAIAKGEYCKEADERVEGEEVNIAPALMLFCGAIMVMRYIAVGIGDRDLYILGGICMGLAYFLRMIIMKISK